MKRLINLTTMLSLALYVVPPFAAQAQDLQTITVDGKEVTCLPNKRAGCPDGAFCVVAKNPANCEANAVTAIADAAAKAATDAAAGTDAAATDATAQAEADAKAAADALAATQAAADKAAADLAAADKAAADKAAADAAAADQAAADQAAADATAADQAAADKAAADKAAADAVAAEQAAADQAAADKAAADKVVADQAAADQAAADLAAKKQEKAAAKAAKLAEEKAAADAAAADAAAADAAAAAATAAATDTTVPTDAPAADATATDTATADATTTATVDATGTATADSAGTATADAATAFATVKVKGKDVICLPNKAAVCPDGALCVLSIKPAKCKANAIKMLDETAQAGTDTSTTATADAGTPTSEPDPAVVAAAEAEDAAAVAAAQKAAADAAAAAAADPTIKPVEAPVPTADAVTTLETVLDAPAATNDATPEVAVAAAADEAVGKKRGQKAPKVDDPAPAGATVTTETVTAADTRDSAQEFAATPVTVAPGKKSHLSDLEKVGLIALGAVVIGAIINGNKQVVANTGDRVVVRQPDGTYQVYKDDNALLREPGSTVRTESYDDGSTRTIVTRADKTQIVTIRDASGRVLQRVAYDQTGHGTVLIDDLQPEQPVIVSQLPRAQPKSNQISLDKSDAELRAQLAAAEVSDNGRRYSLRQIRNIPEVRYLAPTIDVNNITFETGSSAILPSEAKKLSKLGQLIKHMISINPGEVFLIEGHTDAVGSAASNLALSDRRAESVAKALTEYFGVAPENLVVQGYGESELKIDTLGDERKNRRVAVRIITPILRQSAI